MSGGFNCPAFLIMTIMNHSGYHWIEPQPTMNFWPPVGVNSKRRPSTSAGRMLFSLSRFCYSKLSCPLFPRCWTLDDRSEKMGLIIHMGSKMPPMGFPQSACTIQRTGRCGRYCGAAQIRQLMTCLIIYHNLFYLYACLMRPFNA